MYNNDKVMHNILLICYSKYLIITLHLIDVRTVPHSVDEKDNESEVATQTIEWASSYAVAAVIIALIHLQFLFEGVPHYAETVSPYPISNPRPPQHITLPSLVH